MFSPTAARNLALGFAVTVLGGSAALAHHSYGMFDRSKEATVAGTVDEFQWTNPHSRLVVKVQGSEGAMESWDIETGPPGQLVRSGWKRTSLKPGDKVTVLVHPLKDGKPGGHMMMVTLENGEKLYDILFKKPPTDTVKAD